ncbi:MAG: hypothetical protein KAR35_10650, partial [Candidatus Heimdallarchaeota archaeon]|nr:hypothetical protein [Candidatus Heimdallarchaeota archaeon]MCK5049817.1 hypothetical protein [Candidatus Heimdallarchaeota archaeon]
MIDKTVNVNELKFHQCIDDVFYVVIYKDGLPLFEMDNQGIYNEINSLVITGYLKAFCSFTQYLTENNVRYINVGEVSIGFEEGENCAIYYIVKKVTDLIQFKMEVILNVFEMKYGDFLQDNSKYSIPANFDPFNIEVLEILSSEKVQFHYIPHKSLPLIGDSAYEIGDQTHLFSLIDGKRTIREIALLSNYELKEILVLFDTLQHVKVVEFHIKINNDDSFELTGEGIEFFFNNTEKIEEADHLLGEMSPHIIKSINGRRTVSEISQIYDEPISNLKQLLGILLQKGYIS